VIGRAFGAVLRVAPQDVFVNVIAVHVMQVTVVQIVGVSVVLEGRVPAPWPVRVRMLFVCLVGHFALLSQSLNHQSIEQFAC
jgi:hypothetical protein